MKFNCPKCQHEVKVINTHCSQCGLDFSELDIDPSADSKPVDDGPISSMHSISQANARNPFLVDPIDNNAKSLDTNATDSFGTLELNSQASEEDASANPPIDSEPIGTVDSDDSHASSFADIGTTDFGPTSNEETATTDFQQPIPTTLNDSSSSTDAQVADTTDFDGLVETRPDDDANSTDDPNATVTDIQTVAMDTDEFESTIVLGPHGTVVDVGKDLTIELPENGADGAANLTVVDGQSDFTVELGLTVVENSNPETVDLESGTFDFDSSSIIQKSGKTTVAGHDATIETDNSSDFETDSPISNASDDIAHKPQYGATIDVNMLGPSNIDRKGKVNDDADFSIREATANSQNSLAGHTGALGTTGRVQRMWRGAGASQINPGNTLKAASQLASDDVFDLVQPRVLQAEDIGVLVRRAAKNSRDKELIEHCLTSACNVGSDEKADYEINGFLGKGAMGVVLQARQVSIGRDVAIKMIQPPRSENATTVANTRDMHRKFLYEAQITGKLDHPNIVPVYELGTSNAALFYSMKKISGVEWTKKLKQLSQDENLDVWMKIADAMAFSHQRNIIHRDLKPDNVMLGEFGEVLVTDWGCAIDLNVQKKFSGAGSPPWMAPEMALQQHQILGPKSDMYLLGAMLYQIVVGHPPHPGKTAMEALMAAARNQVIQVDNADPLLDIAYRAMRTNPDERYSSLEEMQEAIRQYRRHSESIAISHRCESTLASAIETNDYEKFSRSIFGFQDALQLWTGNEAASNGLARARLAYGKCALSRSDFDLCIESLDPTIPDEAEVLQQAVDQKKAVQLRERRFKTLRKSFAAAVLTGLAVSAVLAAIAWLQRNDAVAQKILAENSAKNEKIAKNEAIQAKDIADEARQAAEDSAVSERRARENEEQAKLKAVSAQQTAELAAESERSAKLAAQSAQRAAEESAEAERLAKQEAVRRSAQVELASMRSNLALALNQVEKTEMARANESLQAVVDANSYRALSNLGLLPNMANWAWNRVKLLSNRDLVQSQWGDRITAVTFDSHSNLGVMAVELDRQFWLKVFAINQGKIEPIENQTIQSPGLVTSIAVLNEGKTVAFTVLPRTNPTDNSYAAYRWNVPTQSIEPLPSIKNESLQELISTDSTTLIGGLNQGLWHWRDLAGNAEPIRIRNIQGRLRSIQVIDANQLVLLAETDNLTAVHWVRLDQPNSREFLQIVSNDAGVSLRPTAVAYAQGKLILGMESGQIFSMDYVPTGRGETKLSLDLLNELPSAHASAIQQIKVHANGTLLTTAMETVVRVWTPSNTPAGWRSLLPLSGPTNNIRSVAFGQGSHQILAVANDATTTLWDTLQQPLRQRIDYPIKSVELPASENLSASASPVGVSNYDAPVIAVVTSQSGTAAVSILANGRIDRWDPRSGRSLGTNSLSYIGHDPMAELVDMDVDESAGVMITAAKLSTRQQSNTAKPNGQLGGEPETLREWEFVKWDLQGGRMLDRWRSATAEERPVSLANSAKYVLYGSDKYTLFQEATSNNETVFRNDDFGSHFSSVNPAQPTDIMLVKLNGVVRVLDLNQPDESWQQSRRQLDEVDFHRVATKSDRVVMGRWAPDGKRYYLIWESGRITELKWEDGQLSVHRDLVEPNEKLDLSLTSSSAQNNAELNLRPASAGTRITSRWSVDAKVRSDETNYTLFVSVCFPGSQGLTRLSRITFPRNAGLIERSVSDSAHPSFPAVLLDSTVPSLSNSLSKWIRATQGTIAQEIVGLRSYGNVVYCATKHGEVYRATDSGLQMLGSPNVISGAGDASASRIVTLHEGGTLWRADWSGQWTWTQLPMVPADSKQIQVSPDGKQILVIRSVGNPALLLDGETGMPLVNETLTQNTVAATWNRLDSSVAILNDSGDLHLVQNDVVKQVAKLQNQEAIDEIHFFKEAWSDNKPASRWIIVRCGQELKFFSLEGPKTATLHLPDGVTTIEPSSTEGIIAVGGQGTVAIYFSAPTLDEPGRELFSLPGHAGSSVRCLRFSTNGETLISTDSQNRQYSWISQPADSR